MLYLCLNLVQHCQASNNDIIVCHFVSGVPAHLRCSISSTLPAIEYRSSDGEKDITRHVFRWDRAPYEFVFQNGFEARRASPASPDEMYFNLEHYVTRGLGRPLDTRRDTTHAYVSTTISSSWYPSVNPGSVLLYRYEIYAPGGIWISQTLGDRYSYSAQDEVVFPVGIAPQYIRSAQIFELTNNRYIHFKPPYDIAALIIYDIATFSGLMVVLIIYEIY